MTWGGEGGAVNADAYIGLYWGYVEIMESKMETPIVYWG